MPQPNILLVVSDQERARQWLPASVQLPWRDRLRAEGLELTNYYTHSSPCSPSRASLFTGQYIAQHHVVDNVIMPEHVELDPATPTIGSLLRDAGYRSSYIGKWHLSQAVSPEMTAYGFADWEGNDRHFMGWAGTGVHFDSIIAANAASWLRENATTLERPWFLTVALVNPHDVMWFPIDQQGYAGRNPEEVKRARAILEWAKWKDDDVLPIFDQSYEQVCEELPLNFHDDLLDKPATQRQWRWDQQHGLWGYIDPGDKKAWLRHLDYYVKLQRLADESLGTVLGALEDAGAYDDTVIVFTSDHGDMCGSHGLRSKGPFVYEEIMHVPCTVRAPGVTAAGSQSSALARTSTSRRPSARLPASIPRNSLPSEVSTSRPCSPTHARRCATYAIRGFFDGTTKYARYYGVGGGKPGTGLWGKDPGRKLYDVDALFEDQEHEWYNLAEDPYELTNLAHDPARRAQLRENYARLLEYEAAEFSSTT